MFIVTFTSEAKELIATEVANQGYVAPGLMIHRQGPKGDVSRTPEGQAEWNIDRPHPWSALVQDLAAIQDSSEDISNFDGVLVWLALIPRLGENGVHVSVQNGQLWVESQ